MRFVFNLSDFKPISLIDDKSMVLWFLLKETVRDTADAGSLP